MRARPLTAPARQLASLLRDGSADVCIPVLDDRLLDAAIVHGVAPLLYRTLKDNGAADRLEATLRARLAMVAREAALYDEVQRRDLHQLLRELAAEGVRPIVFKGSALAVSHYAATWLRPRGDTDFLLTDATAREAGAVLVARGFRRLPRPEGSHVTQARYEARVGGVALAYDVHWRLAEPLVFADCLQFDELEAAAVDMDGMRRLCDVHALLVACMHRVAHHHDTDQLILLYDIDRLARGLTERGWREAVALAVDRGLAAVCLRGLTLAAEGLATPAPDWVGPSLACAAGGEPGARFLVHRLRRTGVLASDLRALGTWRACVGLVRQHLFPSQEYMRAMYGPAGTLAALYAHRIVRGAMRWTQPLGKVRS